MKDIQNWLNGAGNYQDGVAIFCIHSTDQKLIQLFTHETATEFKKKKLKQAMLDLFTSQPAKQVDLKPSLASVPEKSQLATGDMPAAPGLARQKVTKLSQHMPGRWSHPDLQDSTEKTLHEQWQPLFLEKTNLQSRIYDIAKEGTKDPAKKDQAGTMAIRILALAKQIRQIYSERDKYFLTGEIPAAAPAGGRQFSLDPFIAKKELDNATRYVRTMKNKLKKNPLDQAAQERLNYHQAAVDHYTEFFKTKK